MHGEFLVPGYNVDKVDVAAGQRRAAQSGYGSPEHQMVVEYALWRHARGEEDGAQKSALSGGIDLGSWYAILAAAIAAVPGGISDQRVEDTKAVLQMLREQKSWFTEAEREHISGTLLALERVLGGT
jgi:hypothetical protein